MTSSSWQAIGRIAKARRERLGLNQNELAQYGGPGVATVGKFERAAQANFPLRTQHQIEKALGWPRTTIEQYVAAVDDGALGQEALGDWEHDLVEEDVPDLSVQVDDSPRAAMGPLALSVSMLESVLRLMPADRLDAAVRAALVAILPYLDTTGEVRLGQDFYRVMSMGGGEHGGHTAPIDEAEETVYEDLAAYGHDEQGREVPDSKRRDR